MTTLAASRNAWTAALDGMRVWQPTYKPSLVLALTRLFEQSWIQGSEFAMDSKLSDEFDAILLLHGGLIGRGRVFQPLRFMSVRKGGSDQLWEKVPNSNDFRIREPYLPVLLGSDGRTWLRHELAQWLASRNDPVALALGELIEDDLDSRAAIEKLLRVSRAGLDQAGNTGDRPSSLVSLGFRGHEFGSQESLDLAAQMIDAIRAGDTEMKFLDTQSKRRVGQGAFHTWTIANFDGWCGFCPTKGVGLVEAAHILSVKDHPERGMDPRNGIALCPSHHRAFDQDLVWVDRASIRYATTPDFELEGLKAGTREKMQTPHASPDLDALRAHATRAARKWQ